MFLLLLYLYDYPHDHEHLQDVEIKKMSGSATYGFVLFYDLMCAVAAKQFMDGENVHGNNIRVSSLYMYMYIGKHDQLALTYSIQWNPTIRTCA